MCMWPSTNLRLVMFLVVVPLCCGCAIGVKHNYADAVPQLTVSGPGTLAVATHDQRPYIVSGDTGPAFVGLSRGGYGNPFQVQTESARPLAEDMTRVMCRALNAKGFQCVPVIVAAPDRSDEVQRQLQAVAGNLALLLVLHEWKSDTYINTALTYNVTLSVLDSRGAVIVKIDMKGVDDLGGDFWNPPAHARTAVPTAFKQKLEELLDHPEVLAAFQAVNRS